VRALCDFDVSLISESKRSKIFNKALNNYALATGKEDRQEVEKKKERQKITPKPNFREAKAKVIDGGKLRRRQTPS